MAKAKKKAPAKKTAKKPVKKTNLKAAKNKAAKKKPVKKPVKKTVARKPAKKPVPVTVAKKAAKPARKGPKGLPEHLLDAALKVLDERQAEDIVTVDLSGKSVVADYMIIASGRASRQLSAIAHYLREAFAKLGVTKLRVEGASEGNWVLIDAGDIIVHLFRPEVRNYYNLEDIWTK